MGRFPGKVVITTGGASGIGLAAAKGFASEGATVIIADINENAGEAAAEAIQRERGKSRFIKTDVTDKHDVARLFAETERIEGRLDILHSNAYWTSPKACVDVEEEEWDRTVDVILKGAFLCAKHAIPLMRKSSKGGVIIHSASIHSVVAFTDFTAYQTSKAGLLGLTRSLALDYAPDIRVNALIIGCVESPALEIAPEAIRRDLIARTPLKRYGKPEEIAEAAMYLASDAAAFITGSGLVIDGGWTIQ